jgi:hypothetical protein
VKGFYDSVGGAGNDSTAFCFFLTGTADSSIHLFVPDKSLNNVEEALRSGDYQR